MPDIYNAIADSQNDQISRQVSNVRPDYMFRDTDMTDEEWHAFENSATNLARSVGLPFEQAAGILGSQRYIPQRAVTGGDPNSSQMTHKGNLGNGGGFRNWNIPAKQITNPNNQPLSYFQQYQQKHHNDPANTVGNENIDPRDNPAATPEQQATTLWQQMVPNARGIRATQFEGVDPIVKAINTFQTTFQGATGTGQTAEYNPINQAYGKAVEAGNAMTSGTLNALGLGDNGWAQSASNIAGTGLGVGAVNKFQGLLTSKAPGLGKVVPGIGRAYGLTEWTTGAKDAAKAMTTQGAIPSEQAFRDRGDQLAATYGGNTASAFGARFSNNLLYNAGQVGADTAAILGMRNPASILPSFANGSIARNIGHGSREWATLQHTDKQQYAPDDRRSYRNVGQNMWQILGAGDTYHDADKREATRSPYATAAERTADWTGGNPMFKQPQFPRAATPEELEPPKAAPEDQTTKWHNSDLAWNVSGGNVGDMDARAQNMINASKMNQPINMRAVEQANTEFAGNPAYKNMPKPQWLAKRNEYFNQRNVWSKPATPAVPSDVAKRQTANASDELAKQTGKK